MAGDVGALLRAWRVKRRLSQLELSLRAGVSTRHLSCLECGRASPSADMLDTLSEVLELPLRERNGLRLAGGYAPRYSHTGLDAAPMQAVRDAITRVLDAHDPYPGLALDRHWNVVIANRAARRMIDMVAPDLRAGVPNVFRLGLHPRGMAAHTENFDVWGRYLLRALRRLVDESTDPELAKLLEEVRSYPNVRPLLEATSEATPPERELLVSCVLRHSQHRISLFTTLATFGLPRDVTLAELTVELYYPADADSEALLRAAGVENP